MGAVSVVLVAAARVVKDVRPARTVTCVHAPAAPVEPLLGPVASSVTESSPVAAIAAPAFWFEDSAVVVQPGRTGEPVTPPMAALAPGPRAIPRATPERRAIPRGAPEPEATPLPIPAPAEAPRPEPAWGWTDTWSFEIPGPSSPFERGRQTARTARPRTRRLRPRIKRLRSLIGRLRSRIRRLRSRPGEWRRAVVAFAALAFAAGVWIAAPWSFPAPSGVAHANSRFFSPHPSPYAVRTIPAAYMHAYWKVGEEYGLDWTKLAAVGQLESNQGRSHAPGVSHGTNPAGAAGPAQFLSSTWARYGVDATGRGVIDPYDPVDAITAMAAYLKASGAPQHWRWALFTYNHSKGYVHAVMALHRLYLRPRRASTSAS